MDASCIQVTRYNAASQVNNPARLDIVRGNACVSGSHLGVCFPAKNAAVVAATSAKDPNYEPKPAISSELLRRCNKLLDVLRYEQSRSECAGEEQERRMVANGLVAALTVEISCLQAELKRATSLFSGALEVTDPITQLEGDIQQAKKMLREVLLASPARASLPIKSKTGKMLVLA